MKNSRLKIQMHKLTNILVKVAGVNASSMRIRLYVFLFALVIALMLGVIIALQISGLMPKSNMDVGGVAGKELSRLYHQFDEKCGDTTIQLISLSQSLSRSIEFRLAEKRIPVSELQNHTWILEELIGNELGRLQLALEKTNGSGVFIVLDTTVNPEIENAENSKAGLYIRISEPKVAGAADATWLFFRGYPGIAYKNRLNLQVKWEMEFDVKDQAYFHRPMESSIGSPLPLSKLYFWSLESIIQDSVNNTLLCSIPLIDSNGNVFGVCGFEISDWNFKSNYMPVYSEFHESLVLFGTMDMKRLNTSNALISGESAHISNIRNSEGLTVSPGKRINTYELAKKGAYYGLHEEIKLHSNNSPFFEQKFFLSFLISKDEVDLRTQSDNLQLIIFCLAFLSVGTVISFFIGKRYLSPIMSALSAIRSGDLTGIRTNIAEIDQLIEQMRDMRSENYQVSDGLFTDFINRVKMLTPAEKKIFRLYLEGMNDKEVFRKMYVSKSILKSHNERIYEKLGVSGKESFLLYIELIKMSGQADRIV